MLELVASGQNQETRYTLEPGQRVRFGRAPRAGWRIGWDRKISREHADVEICDGHVVVRRLGTARNPLVYSGGEHNELVLDAGQAFRIGDTDFFIVSTEASEEDRPAFEQTFGSEELKRFRFGSAEKRLEALSRLPDLMSRSRSDEEFAASLVDLLLLGIPKAEAAAAVRMKEPATGGEVSLSTLRWNARSLATRFRPSRRLISAAVASSESILHYWRGDESDPTFTVSLGLDWAFCVPVPSESCQGWCLYVSGVTEDDPTTTQVNRDLRGDIRFAEMMARFVASICELRQLEKRQHGLSYFFSPSVMEMLVSADSEETLAPKESDVSILFCDLRGFSRRAEAPGDLHRLLNRVSGALGVMTRGVMRYEGAIADFQGDAALAFWGWPTPLEDGPISACQAALAIHDEFRRATGDPQNPLYGFQVGIGIGHGRAIAGKIGTVEQVKVGVFGNVVNVTSRLEGMTKQFRVPILIDETTAGFVQRYAAGLARVRRLGRIRPAGMQQPATVFELMPAAHVPGALPDEVVRAHETAVQHFCGGQWDRAMDIFGRLPVDDRAKDLLMWYIAQHQYRPPQNWDGVIDLTSK